MEKFKIVLPEYINKALAFLKNKYPSCEAYIVGGSVRDSLLKRTVHDFDITTNLTPTEVMSCFSENHIVNNNGLKHGTVSVVIDHEVVEITTYRNDGTYSDGRHPNEVSFVSTLKEDLKRRDFTINAMAYNSDEGLIDYNEGINDLENKIIRTVGNPYQRFEEDYLRILRALRFSSTLSFEIENKTKEAIHNEKEGLTKISYERIRKELEGILTGPNVFYILKEFSDVLEVIIPELKMCTHFMQNNKYHKHQNLYEHMINVVSLTKPDFILRLAALIHDIGKPDCYSEEIIDGVINGHFYKHPYVSAKYAKVIGERLKLSSNELTELIFLVEYHDAYLFAQKKIVKRMLAKTPNQDVKIFLKLVNLRWADATDHQNLDPEFIPKPDELKALVDTIIKENEALRLSDLMVNGNDLMALGYKGKILGIILNDLLEHVIDESLLNQKDELLSYVKSNYEL